MHFVIFVFFCFWVISADFENSPKKPKKILETEIQCLFFGAKHSGAKSWRIFFYFYFQKKHTKHANSHVKKQYAFLSVFIKSHPKQ